MSDQQELGKGEGRPDTSPDNRPDDGLEVLKERALEGGGNPKEHGGSEASPPPRSDPDGQQ